MTYEQWIQEAEKVLNQYQEGAIFSAEAFNKILSLAVEVEQHEICFSCGEKLEENHECSLF